jgi:hypothetical protein
LANVRYWHKADNSSALGFVRYWTKADKGGFWPMRALAANDTKADARDQEFFEIFLKKEVCDSRSQYYGSVY